MVLKVSVVPPPTGHTLGESSSTLISDALHLHDFVCMYNNACTHMHTGNNTHNDKHISYFHESDSEIMDSMV